MDKQEIRANVLAAETELVGIHSYLRNIREALREHDTSDDEKMAYIELQRALANRAIDQAKQFINNTVCEVSTR